MENDVTIRATGSPMLWYCGTNGNLYRVDMTDPRELDRRERALAKSLLTYALDWMEEEDAK